MVFRSICSPFMYINPLLPDNMEDGGGGSVLWGRLGGSVLSIRLLISVQVAIPAPSTRSVKPAWESLFSLSLCPSLPLMLSLL